MGFFAEAGPVELFVSQHLIPGHYAFDNASEPIYESNEGSPSIRVGSTVRVRVLRAKEEITTIVRHPVQPLLERAFAVWPSAALC